MLTIRKVKVERGLEAVIAVPPEMSEQDRGRLARLAVVFYGHHTLKPDAYVFTEARGRKCWDLFSAGFDAKSRYAKSDRTCITHPAIVLPSNKFEPRPLRVPEALALIAVVTAVPVASEEWA